jgi:hypothetical protein
MSMTLELRIEGDILKVGAMGKFSLAEARRTFLEMLEALARHEVRKVLFDGRQITGEPQTMERFYFATFAADSVINFAARGISPATRFAYVLEEPVLDARRFGETVAVNRGMLVRAFDNLDDAIEWLGTAPVD